MADHAELIKEMGEIEKLSSQERLKRAKKRRQSQLKKCTDHEKKVEKEEKTANKRKTKGSSMPPATRPPRVARIMFESSVKLLEAAARNDVDEVVHLLEEGVNPDVANEDGLTALHQCCIDDSEDMLLALLRFGANVNSRDSELWTPLHAAATCGHLQICNHLVEKNADLLAVNADGNMPYDICEDEATLEYIETCMANQGVTQELIDETRLSNEKKMLDDIKEYEREGNSPSSWCDRAGATLLHISAANGYYDVTSYLLTKRIDVNAVDNDGWTPAHAAACWGQVAVLELLAKHGVDLERKTKDNKTMLDLVDDQEVKEEIEKITIEAKNNLEKFKRDNDVRRRSSHNVRSLGVTSMYSSNTSLSDRNPFSSSVRRHSMREKHKLSVKEARDEARYRIAINTDSNEESTQPPSPDAIPVTNIDDVNVSVPDSNVAVTENNVTTINITIESPSPEETVEETVKARLSPPIPAVRMSLTSLPSPDSPVMETKPATETSTQQHATCTIRIGDNDNEKEEVVMISDKNDNKTEPVVNGHKTGSLPAGGDPPLKKYIATPDQHEPAAVLGSQKKKSGCCVIS